MIIEQDDLLIKERYAKAQLLIYEAFNFYSQKSYLRSYEKFTEACNLGSDSITFQIYSVFSFVSKEIGEYEMTLKLIDKADSMKEELNEDKWEVLQICTIIITIFIMI